MKRITNFLLFICVTFLILKLIGSIFDISIFSVLGVLFVGLLIIIFLFFNTSLLNFNTLPKFDIDLAQTSHKKFAIAKQWLDKLYEKRLFSGSIIIKRSDIITEEHHYGYQTFKQQNAINSKSLYCLSNLSELLVKLSILLLEKRGKLKLTDLVSKHLNFEESLGNACINHVVFNLIETDFDAYFKIEETYQIHEVLDSKDVLRLFVESKEKLILKDYGINRFYSTKRNTLNIALLIEIIEKVSGEAYTSFVKSELLDPLQMNSTIFLNRDKINSELEKNIIEGIKHSKKETKRLIDSDYTINGLNNLYSCTDDLKKLLNALTTENSNLPESIKQLFSKIEKPYKRYDEKTRDYYIKYGINDIKYSSFDLLELVEHRYGIYENLFLNRSNGDYMLILDNQYTNSNHIQKQLIKLLHRIA